MVIGMLLKFTFVFEIVIRKQIKSYFTKLQELINLLMPKHSIINEGFLQK